MDTAITLGNVLWFFLMAGGVVIVLGVCVAILSAIGRGYSM
jgi:hypothetical protein